MKRNGKRHFESIWIRTGLLLLTAALFLTVYNIWDAWRADRASQDVVTILAEEIEENADDPDAPRAEDQPEEREMPTIEIDGYRYIGYLYVPNLDLELPVMEEWDYDRLKIAPCRYSGSVYLDNMVIAGHNYRRHFSPLRWQELGTEIDFTDVEGNVYRYQISNVEILNPDQTEDLVKESDDWDLTLFTCTIGGQTRHTIRCTRIN